MASVFLINYSTVQIYLTFNNLLKRVIPFVADVLNIPTIIFRQSENGLVTTVSVNLAVGQLDRIPTVFKVVLELYLEDEGNSLYHRITIRQERLTA